MEKIKIKKSKSKKRLSVSRVSKKLADDGLVGIPIFAQPTDFDVRDELVRFDSYSQREFND